jgi:hypothetical protein
LEQIFLVDAGNEPRSRRRGKMIKCGTLITFNFVAKSDFNARKYIAAKFELIPRMADCKQYFK